MTSYNGSLINRISAIALLFLMTCHQVAECQGTILDSLFTFRAGTVKTGNALSIIARQTGYNFTYDSRLVSTENKIDLIFSKEKLSAILNGILRNDSLVFSVIDKYIIISKALPVKIQGTDTIPRAESFYISGIIIDDDSREPLPFATISLKNSGKGTVTNNNGEFGLKISRESLTDTLSVSYLGFIRREITVEQSLGNNFTISMKRDFISIPEIIIKTQVPQEIIYKAIAAIPHNYGNSPAMLTGFYREGVMKKQELQIYSEAILHIYKSAYSGTLLNDQIKVFKSRKVENTILRDTLALRLKGGLGSCLDLDVTRHLLDFIAREYMAEYYYRITDIVSTDEESAFVIDFEQKDGIDRPLYKGAVYINTEDFAVLHADFEIPQKYIRSMRDSYVSRSARGYNTWLGSAKYSVGYRKFNDRYFLNHVRGDLIFTTKQKKKLFNSQFHVFFELAITDINTVNVSRFEKEELAPVHSVFSKTITTYDPEFWGNQDFLKPEDNLLQALKNMKVKLQEFPGEKN
jgi:hypothetical protein